MVLGNILCDLDPKVKVTGKKAGICDGVPSTVILVIFKSCQTYLNCVGLLGHLSERGMD